MANAAVYPEGLVFGYLVAACAVASGVVGFRALRRGDSPRTSIILLLAPWLVALVVDIELFVFLLTFALHPKGWGSFDYPAWISTCVGVGLLVGIIRRGRGRSNAAVSK